ncbi:polysaccharide biosynthesis protein [Francisella tularensis]|uniref:polysaccharide biosynthesis protein n=1 Tax=Francisella tularensis TaxID=263 RepID=UPI000173E393|nr:nucleoside-diphosphate sugar epimerase/dehydratase [Francisella tularensis]ACD31320.1 dTDP-glucose 4,6-dehydratase [Francisella tularensis subsp. mediasiatica FSC147]MBK2101765.1 polysaccharide biosynthesis protein [Francisella tularensis subsp. mediasiatica]MBK2104331.1 polysaccharide biosynthesis protein [Francisella tularensis subsp. mediasiatica]MDN9003653.1 nucleoside-diphosphate sugar epimerase/dehydratase [Francisella tularensis subsp. mediasiatica]MDN9007870.1 nucleoside-diphosphate
MSFYDNRTLNFVVIIVLTIITVNWTFYIFKQDVNLHFLLALVLLRCLSSFLLLRDYMASWRKSTQKTFLRKAFINLPVFFIVALFFYGKVTFSLIFSEFLFYVFLISLSVYFYWYLMNRGSVDKSKTAVIYGAGAAGTKIAQELASAGYRIKCFVDDNETLQKRSIDSKKVLSKAELTKLLLSSRFDLLVIALPRNANQVVKNIYKEFEKDFNQIRIMPPLEEILQDENFMSQLKPVSLYDLLARDTKSLDKESISNFIKNKVVLVTGAGGSIGSEIVHKCIKYQAKELILVDHSEFNLYKITEECSHFNINSVLCSVCDRKALAEVFQKYTPNIVFHAAAYKHVPLVEENISRAIRNNILGTKNAIDLAIEAGVESFILISTDKAVRPTNVMGATKRVCELYLQNVDPKNTKLAAVRFGNVLGSSGSVIPKFEEQIRNGGPVTVTHPEITRYFMLIPEACELVLQAGAIAKNSEVFVLDMGQPVKIIDLAKQFIRLSGRGDIDIKIVGLRPGEKLYEELLIEEDDVSTDYKDIFIGRRTFYDINTLNQDIESLIKDDVDQLVILKKIVPEFEHRLNG